MPEADTVLQRIRFSGLLNNGKADWAIMGEGVEPDKENHLGTFVRITAGRQLKDEDTSGVLIGDGVAKALALASRAMPCHADHEYGRWRSEHDGIERRRRFQSFSKDFDTRAVRIPIDAARSLVSREGANSIVLLLHRTADTGLVKNLLIPRLQSLGFDIRDWVELSDFYAKTVELYRTQFGVLQWIVLIMVLLSVFNTVNMSVFERVGEFGTLMALGNTRGYVFRLVMVENVMLGLFGAVVGVVHWVLLALAITEVGIPMPPPPNSNVGYTASIRVLPDTVACWLSRRGGCYPRWPRCCRRAVFHGRPSSMRCATTSDGS
jgi:putative ABC transport system permease protein